MNRRLVMMFGLVLLLIVAAWYALLWRPANDDLAAAEQRLSVAEAQREQLQVQQRNLESLTDERPRLQSEIEQLRAAVPDRAGVADILLLVDEAARDAGLSFVNYTSSEAGTADTFGLSSVQIQITGDGGYFQVLDFINRLGRFERVLVVDSVSLTGAQDEDTLGPPIIDLTLGVTAYVAGAAGATDGTVQTTATDGADATVNEEGTE